jgi:hypothetical protein
MPSAGIPIAGKPHMRSPIAPRNQAHRSLRPDTDVANLRKRSTAATAVRLIRGTALVALAWSIGCSSSGQGGAGGEGGGAPGGAGGSAALGGAAGTNQPDAGTGGAGGGAGGGGVGNAGGGNAAALVSTQFVSYEYYLSFDQPCTTGCTTTLTITPDGTISTSTAGSATKSATLSDQDLQTFAAWAISQEHIDALQADDCPPLADGVTGVSVGIRSGISVTVRDGCSVAIMAVTDFAQGLATQYLSGGATATLPVPGIVHPELAAKIDWSKLSFSDLELSSVGEIGPDGTIYGPGLYTGPILAPATLADLQRQATSLDLVAAWPGSCAPASITSNLQLELSPAIVMQTGTQGCADGPITALENLLRSAVDSLPGTGGAGGDGGGGYGGHAGGGGQAAGGAGGGAGAGSPSGGAGGTS